MRSAVQLFNLSMKRVTLMHDALALSGKRSRPAAYTCTERKDTLSMRALIVASLASQRQNEIVCVELGMATGQFGASTDSLGERGEA
eukprot:4584748-Pleurochrysis_carterae.AAC.1